VLVCTHTLQKLKDIFERQKHTSVTTTTVCTYNLKVSQQNNGNPLQTKYKACRGGLNPINAVSRINVAILGVFLGPVYQRKQNSTDHAIQNHVYWQGGIFTSRALEPLSSLTAHRSANGKESAGRLDSQGCQIFFFDARFHRFGIFLETIDIKKLFVFSQFLTFFGGS